MVAAVVSFGSMRPSQAPQRLIQRPWGGHSHSSKPQIICVQKAHESASCRHADVMATARPCMLVQIPVRGVLSPPGTSPMRACSNVMGPFPKLRLQRLSNRTLCAAAANGIVFCSFRRTPMGACGGQGAYGRIKGVASC